MNIQIFSNISSALFIEKQSIDKVNEVKDWTFMFFCSGDQDNASESYNNSLLLAQNLFMKMPIFSKLKINIVVLIDTARVIYGGFKPSNLQSINKFDLFEEYDEINMGNYTVLRDYISRCKQDFPAKNYLFYGFGHGGAWEGAFPDYPTNDTEKPYDMLTMEKIRLALEESGGVNIILLGNCIMASLEPAYELRNCTDVYISSQEVTTTLSIPITIWYNCVNILKKNHDLSSYDIAEKIVNSFKPIYRYNWSPFHYLRALELFLLRKNLSMGWPHVFTFSAIRTDKINKLCYDLDDLIELYIENQSKYEANFLKARSNVEDFPHDFLAETEPTKGFLIDIYHFADLISKEAEANSELSLSNEAEEVKNCINEAIINEWHQKDHPNAHGISLFCSIDKNFTNPDPFTIYNYDSYVNTKLRYKNDFLWDEFLDIFLK